MNNEDTIPFVAIVIAIIVIFFLGFAVARKFCIEDAIEANVGEYHPKTGNFQFKTNFVTVTNIVYVKQ
jgi:hypothetical protein